jgi:hypothetical protein
LAATGASGLSVAVSRIGANAFFVDSIRDMRVAAIRNVSQ